MRALTSPDADAAQRLARARARRADAARMLPLLGVALLLAPDLILAQEEAAQGATLPWLIYLFAAWLALISLAAWIARAHLRDDTDSGAGNGAGGGAGDGPATDAQPAVAPDDSPPRDA